MSLRRYLLAIPVGIILAACGGSSAEVGDIPDSGGGDDANSDGTTADSGGNGDAAGNGDTSMGSDTGSETGSDASLHDSGLNDSALTLDGNDGGGCPNTIGGYTMEVATGTGCGDINVTAKQCVAHPGAVINPNLCLIRFNSEQVVHPLAVNGPLGGIDLKPNGTFDATDLLLGTTGRSNCTGVFNEATQTMTVTCASGGGCVVTMVRTSATCP